MGNAPLIRRASFEDVQFAKEGKCLVISVLNEHEQSVLIKGTVAAGDEVRLVEDALLHKRDIIVYGLHSSDSRVLAKCEQILKLGGHPVAYVGGLFEWLLLQDIYGSDAFPTNGFSLDHLRFKPNNVLAVQYLM
jgi:hypothetical protein